MSNLVTEFIDKSKSDIIALRDSNPSMADAVMRALVVLADYEKLVPQNESTQNAQAIDEALAKMTLVTIDPASRPQGLSVQQQQALQNQGYNGTSESSTQDDDIDAIAAILDAIPDDVMNIDIDDLEDDLKDILDSI